MARGYAQSKSELPSGYENSRKEVQNQAEAQNYEKNWEKLTGFTPSAKDPGWGNGEVGNGIMKDGQLHLRDEDINEIVRMNLGPVKLKDGKNYSWAEDALDGDDKSFFEGFTPIVGMSAREDKANTIFPDKKAPFIEIVSHAFDLPGSDNIEPGDYEESKPAGRNAGGRLPYGEPPEDAYGSFNYGESYVDARKLQVDYNKASGGKVRLDRDSADRLAAAFESEFDGAIESIASRAAENFDWDEHARNRRDDYESDRGRDDD